MTSLLLRRTIGRSAAAASDQRSHHHMRLSRRLSVLGACTAATVTTYATTSVSDFFAPPNLTSIATYTFSSPLPVRAAFVRASSGEHRRREAAELFGRMASTKSAADTQQPQSSSADCASSAAAASHPLEPLTRNFDHTWLSHLDAETEHSQRKALDYSAHSSTDHPQFNRSKRPVFNGHYVRVAPTALKNPRLVLHSPDMVRRLGLDESAVQSEEFARFFSGDLDGAGNAHLSDGEDHSSWATPYALSIMGTRYTSNCPFGTGDGYGDGRAISIGEVVVSPQFAEPPASPRYELQLKGAGPTPFCRGADGRAVLRSSIREFLASEAMFHLGVKTTRALSLVKSEGPDGDTSMRPWYSSGSKRQLPSLDDPRLAQYSDSQKRQILAQLKVQSRDNPDVMIQEPCAITCRVSPSFVRIGHLDLFARRATKKGGGGGADKTQSEEWQALEKLIWHACYREFPATAYEPYKDSDDVASAAKTLLRGSMDGIAAMVAGWIRVGFTQGNFNADNCLVGGRTMDYGPFGFVDEYHPLYAKWTGSGEHFGFLNQPQAGFTNFAVMVESVLPVIEAHEGAAAANAFKEELMKESAETFQGKVDEVLRAKMGFHPTDASADELWAELEPMFRETRVDWTMFWRQLYEVVKAYPVVEGGSGISTEYGDMLSLLVANECKKEGSSPFYETLSDEARSKYLKWVKQWREALVASYEEGGASTKGMAADGDNAISAEERMRTANPKYILRESTLVDAYNKAAKGDEYMIKELLDLVENPYDEGTKEQSDKYFRRAPDEALKAGGTAYMS